MGQMDTETKKYMSDNARFADAFNYLIYDGAPLINPSELIAADTAEIVVPYGNEAREPKQKFRDVVRNWTVKRDDRAIYAVLALENQTKIHYAMPVRDMLYDAMHYAGQVDQTARSYRAAQGKKFSGMSGSEYLSGFRKGDRLLPVITLVVYFGASAWDGPMSIHDMLAPADKKLLRFVPDYRINLIAPADIPEGDFSKFSTGFGKVMEYIKYSKDKEKLYQVTQRGNRFRSIDRDSAVLMNLITNSGLKIDEKEADIDMCQAIREMRQDAWNEGKREGELNGKREGILETLAGLVEDRLLNLSDAAAKVNMTVEEFQTETAALLRNGA